MISPAGNLGISLLLDDPVVQNLQAKKIYRSIYLHIYIYVCVCVCACVLSRFSSVQPFVTLWTVAYWVPLSLGFSGQEYWSGLPRPPQRDLSDPGIEPPCLLRLLHWQASSLPLALPGKLTYICTYMLIMH